MKLSKSLVIAALVGAVTLGEAAAIQRHHHHHHSYVQVQDDAKAAKAAPAEDAAEAAADAGAASPKEAAAEAKEEVKEKQGPTAEETIAAAKEVLKEKPVPQSSEAQRMWAESKAADAAEAASVAEHDALGKSIFADMYKGRAQSKLDAAAAAAKAEDDMVAVLKARMEVNAAAEKARQAAAFKAHKAHVLHVKEHYAKLEADASKDVADAHAAWKAKYGAQKRLPLDTPGETWTANMPDHVIEDGDFHIKAPAPVEKVLKEAEKAEAKAEDDAKPKKAPTAAEELKAKGGEAGAVEAAAAEEAAPAFVQLYRRKNLAQQRAESSESESESSGSSGSDSNTDSSSSSDSD